MFSRVCGFDIWVCFECIEIKGPEQRHQNKWAVVEFTNRSTLTLDIALIAAITDC